MVNPSKDSSAIFINPEVGPVIKDEGNLDLKQFVRKNLRYPSDGACIEGTVVVRATIDTVGNVRNVHVVKKLYHLTDEEAIRVVKIMKFTPGTWYGKPIEMDMNIPIRFRISAYEE